MSGKKSESASNQMWGGRFASGPAAIMEEINASIDFDRKLYAEDIAGSIAHAAMLAKSGIITGEDRDTITHGLNTILSEIENGSFGFSRRLEDIHMNIEARLADLIGPAAGRLHTARSRNDQVALDFRLWVKRELQNAERALTGLISAFLDRAEEHAGTVMPGFTHLQTAQPVTFGHHCMAYVEMFGRDRSRVADCIARMDESPLGAAALAGTGFPIDRHMTAQALGFREPTRNSIDSVSDRDFALEYLSIAAICATHLSRLAEEIVIWSTPQFAFVRLSDAFSTGSSIMPQKKNPDAAELVRAKTGRINGALIALLTDHEGPAARLFQGHAGRQGAGLRRRRKSRTGACRHDRHGQRHDGRRRGDAPRRRLRLLDGDRSCRLAGARGEPALPRGASRDRLGRRARREEGLRSRGPAARRTSGDQSRDHRGRLRRADGRCLRRQPHELRRHRAGSR